MGPVWLTLSTYILASFALGGVHFALLLGKLGGVDIRQTGSGNVGATNLGRSLGVSWGVSAFFLDAAKGFFPVFLWELSSVYSEAPLWSTLIVAFAAILGHCFSPLLRFKGGKGVATTAGAVLAISPWISLLLLASWIAGMVIFKKVGLASSLVAIVSTVLGALSLAGQLQWIGNEFEAWFFVALGVLVLIRHKSNIVSSLTVGKN